MARSRTKVPALRVLLVMTIAGCSDPAAPNGLIDQAASMIIVSGDAQTTLEYTELPQPIVVQVLNAKGKPVNGQVVNFRVVQGGGSVYAGAAITDNQGIAREWWTVGSSAIRNLLEARAVDPTTGAQVLLGTVVNAPLPLDNPRIQFKCGNQPDWEPPVTGPRPGECYGPGPEIPGYRRGTAIPMQVRVIHGPDAAPVPVPRMWLDFYAFHNSTTGTPPSVTPVYGVTNSLGVASLTFTIGQVLVGNDLYVVGPLDYFSREPVVERFQPFRVDP
jgi:hypothetical protein